jgi:hypothetical protein
VLCCLPLSRCRTATSASAVAGIQDALTPSARERAPMLKRSPSVRSFQRTGNNIRGNLLPGFAVRGWNKLIAKLYRGRRSSRLSGSYCGTCSGPTLRRKHSRWHFPDNGHGPNLLARPSNLLALTENICRSILAKAAMGPTWAACGRRPCAKADKERNNKPSVRVVFTGPPADGDKCVLRGLAMDA